MKTSISRIINLISLVSLLVMFGCKPYPIKVTSITTYSVDSISYTFAKVKGSIIDNSGNVSNYGHCWGIEDNPTTSNSKTSLGKTASNVDFSSELTGLIAGTKYFIRAYAIDGNNMVYSKDVVNFTTLNYITSILITSNISDTTYTSAVCGGNISSDGGSPITSRGVCWSTTENPTISSNKTINGSGTGLFTSNITGLTAGTTYYVRAYATNGVGTAYGNQQNFTTPAYSLPTLTTSSPLFTHNSATTGGNVSADGGTPVTAKGVCWSTSENPTISLPTKTNDGTGLGPFNSTINGLTSNTPYYLRAYATNSQGTSYGDQKNFTTSQAPYISIISPGIDSLWEMSYNKQIKWDDNITENVKIELLKGGSTIKEIEASIPSSGTYNWLIPVDLTAANNYAIKISSINNANISDTSETFEIFGKIYDIEGNTYRIVKIGNQWWMRENLRVAHYSDFTAITKISSNVTWDNLAYYDAAYCYYNNDSATYASTFGVLYTWAAAMKMQYLPNNQGVCPSGWHIPTDDEYKTLEIELGMGASIANNTGWRGANEGEKLKSIDFWTGTSSQFTNSSKFNAYPAGIRSNNGLFYYTGEYTYFWTSSHSGLYDAWCRGLYYGYTTINRNIYPVTYGRSVRCLKNN